MGWEPAETTTYQYAPVVWYKPWTWAPKLVSSNTSREVEWDDYEREMFQSFAAFSADMHVCGHPLSETTSKFADPNNSKADHFYKAELPFRCWACDAIEKMKDQYSKDYGADAARIFTARRIDIER